jgi:hypothetical protein
MSTKATKIYNKSVNSTWKDYKSLYLGWSGEGSKGERQWGKCK